MGKQWKLVVFDCDGVLVDSRKVVDDLMIPHCRARQLTYDRNKMFAQHPQGYLQQREYDPIQFMHDLAAVYLQAPIRWDTIKTVESLRQQKPNTKIVVITSNATQIVKNRLASEQVDTLFDEIYGHDATDFESIEIPPELKSRKAKQVFFLLNQLGISHEDCCFFGDTTSDLIAAAEVNVHRFVMVGGFQDDDYLRRHSKNVVHSQAELMMILGLAPVD